MVALALRSPRFVLMLFGLLMLCSAQLRAQDISVEALVDRASIRENESFTYTLRVEGSVRGDPSVEGLSENFDVLNRSTSTRIQIVNGQTQQVAEWQYQLMPRTAGTFTIPPASIGGSASNPIDIQVFAGPPPGDELEDIFMEVEAAPGAAYVQSQIIFTLRLYVGIGTGRATLTTPEVDGVEAIVERLGEDANYSTLRGGRNFVVRERRYAVFPQSPGNLRIGPVVFEVMVIPNRGFSRVQRYRSDSVDVEVLPAVAPPAQYPQAVWLPASRVELSQRWSETDTPLEMGVPRTRALTIEADGLLETQLPDLDITAADGIRQYADQPELERIVGTAGLTAQRTERFAVIAQRAGSVELPAVELPWWNVNTGAWEVARIEPDALEVTPSTEAVAPALDVPAPADAEVLTVVEQPVLAWWLSGLFGVGWLVTALAWWRSARRGPATVPPKAVKVESPRAALRRLEAACAGANAAQARDALLAWAAAEPKFAEFTSLGALAHRLPDEAARAVRSLEKHLYAPGAEAWDAAALASAIVALKRSTQAASTKNRDPLPSLYN